MAFELAPSSDAPTSHTSQSAFDAPRERTDIDPRQGSTRSPSVTEQVRPL